MNYNREGGKMMYYKGFIYLLGGYGYSKDKWLRIRQIERYKLDKNIINGSWQVVEYSLWEGLENLEVFRGPGDNQVVVLGGQTNYLYQNKQMWVFNLD